MLQALLAERFKLAIHRESKEQAVYAMVMGKGGLKIKEIRDSAGRAGGTAPNPGVTGSSSVSISQTKGGATVSDGTGKSQKMIPVAGRQVDAAGNHRAPHWRSWRRACRPLTDHPVVDMTGLSGKYDMTLDISMQELMNVARAAGAAVPPPPTGDAASDPGNTVAMAVQAVGLKLDARKIPTAFIVVDHIEKMPTEN